MIDQFGQSRRDLQRFCRRFIKLLREISILAPSIS
jgi:hypothetical protein